MQYLLEVSVFLNQSTYRQGVYETDENEMGRQKSLTSGTRQPKWRMSQFAIRLKDSSHYVGIVWMIAAGVLFVAVAVTVRFLGTDMPAVEAAFIRYVLGLLLLTPVLIKIQWRRSIRRNMKLYIARGLVHGFAVMLWFFAMARIPIAEVMAIGYAAPIFTALGAVVVFKERIRIRRVIAISVGFIGMLVILRPGLTTISIGAAAQLLAASCFAISFLFTKKLTQTEDSSEILVMLSIFCTLALLPGALSQWQHPQLDQLFWLLLTAIFATAGHYALTKSIANAPLTVTQPFSFLQLVWAAIIGYVFFREIPDIWVCVGGMMIVGAISYMTHREAVAKRRGRMSVTSPVSL